MLEKLITGFLYTKGHYLGLRFIDSEIVDILQANQIETCKNSEIQIFNAKAEMSIFKLSEIENIKITKTDLKNNNLKIYKLLKLLNDRPKLKEEVEDILEKSILIN